MKRTVYFFFALLSLLFSTQPSKAQQAFYIYRNDGVINAFVTTEIDSMTYSRLDADSLMHDDYVVQEVYTPDSIYRIPIEKIDSVGFVTPETKYQPGVTVLEGKLRSYIVSCEGLTLTFRSDIPNSLLPRKGDKLVSTESDEYLESAFLGEVASVRDVTDGIEVVCEPVTLTDVFECYYGVVQNDEQQQTRGIKDGFYSTNGYKTFTLGRLTHNMFRSFEYEKSDELSFSLNNAEASISLTPEIKCSGFLIVNKEYGINISLSIIGNH